MMGRPTPVVRTEERGGVTRWAYGHLAATRDIRFGIRLVVGEASTRNTASTPGLTPQQAIFASDCLRAASANAGSSACAGKSILEMLWEELDAIVDRIMTEQDSEDGRDPGRAEGVAYCIAVFTNPYLPNLDAIREQAMDRWYEDNDE